MVRNLQVALIFFVLAASSASATLVSAVASSTRASSLRIDDAVGAEVGTHTTNTTTTLTFAHNCYQKSTSVTGNHRRFYCQFIVDALTTAEFQKLAGVQFKEVPLSSSSSSKVQKVDFFVLDTEFRNKHQRFGNKSKVIWVEPNDPASVMHTSLLMDPHTIGFFKHMLWNDGGILCNRGQTGLETRHKFVLGAVQHRNTSSDPIPRTTEAANNLTARTSFSVLKDRDLSFSDLKHAAFNFAAALSVTNKKEKKHIQGCADAEPFPEHVHKRMFLQPFHNTIERGQRKWLRLHRQ